MRPGRAKVAAQPVRPFGHLVHLWPRRWCPRMWWCLLAAAAAWAVLAFLRADCIPLPDRPRLLRPPEDCSLCDGLLQVDRVSALPPDVFLREYAQPGVPVVVLDGAVGWPAVREFTFDFFKALYSRAAGRRDPGCQFFPYRTQFRSLGEALNMSEARARLEPGTENWYIGWRNCDDQAGSELRKYYSSPYFLPKTSENIAVSWIFMGGPGHGAPLHVDDVHYPSWQAQLKGQKRWRLVPPPECLFRCKELEVTVKPGEVIVVDTNRWYHQTDIIPGEISITLGNEFD